ncbi:MAG: hypothetical protein EZS28_036607, partial [Streblomastix strix]
MGIQKSSTYGLFHHPVEQTSTESRMDMKPEANRENFSKIKNPLNWNRTLKYDNRNRGESWGDDPNDKWTKRTQMQKDPPENHSDKDSIWTEDGALNTNQQQHNPNNLFFQHNEHNKCKYNQNNRPQLKYQDKEVEEMQCQTKTILMNMKYYKKINSSASRRINTGMNKDKPSSQTQLFDTSTEKTTHRVGFKQRQKKMQRVMKRLQTCQQLEQQENSDINNMDADTTDIQGTVGQLT